MKDFKDFDWMDWSIFFVLPISLWSSVYIVAYIAKVIQ